MVELCFGRFSSCLIELISWPLPGRRTRPGSHLATPVPLTAGMTEPTQALPVGLFALTLEVTAFLRNNFP